MPRAFNDHLLKNARHRNAPSPGASHGKRVQLRGGKSVPSRSPGPSQNAPGQAHNAGPRAPTMPRGEAAVGLDRAACWQKQRALGLVTLPSGRGSRHAAGLYRPLPSMPRAAPSTRHSPTPAAPGSGSAVAAARPGTKPAFREAGRARGERRSGRVRGQTDHSPPSVGRGVQRSARAAEFTPAGVSGSAAHGPAGLGTVRGPKGEEASRIARACVRGRANASYK